MGQNTLIISFVLFNLLFIVFICAIVIFIREYKRKKKNHLKELETKDFLHKKELLNTQIEIQEQTMNDIGIEIHDNVGQKLTLSSLYLQQIVIENNAPLATENINNVIQLINEALTELRQLSKTLTHDSIKDWTLEKLIKKEVEKINKLKKYQVTFNNDLKLERLSYQIKSVLLRIVQEFIQNSLKHSNCKNINIALTPIGDDLKLILKDDGKGFDVKTVNSLGIGLKNINKRVEILNGFSNLYSDKSGTVLTLTIPLYK